MPQQEKKTVYLVKRTVNGEQHGNGGRFNDKQVAQEAAAALKRTGEKGVRLVTRRQQ